MFTDMQTRQIMKNAPSAAKQRTNLYAFRVNSCVEHAELDSSGLNTDPAKGLRKLFGAKEAV
jgi:hypothetical protein